MARKLRSEKRPRQDAHAYWQAVREKVCRVCLDGDGHGNCRLDAEFDCPLQTQLPRIVQIVGNLQADSMERYLRELHMIVCTECTFQSASGHCQLREDEECALERYFPLVVETIEAVHHASRRSRSRSS